MYYFKNTWTTCMVTFPRKIFCDFFSVRRYLKDTRLFYFGLTCGLLISFVFSSTLSLSFKQMVSSSNKIRQSVYSVQDLHNISVAERLEKDIRVLCWIMTCRKNLEKKAIHVKNTWAKRCNIVLFFTATTNNTFPTVGLNVSDERKHLTAKTMQGFRYVYEHYRDAADWFMKADDDTYVILENLRYFLSRHNTNNPVYFGHKFKKFLKQGFYSGGAGYVLSKEALRRLATQGNNPFFCAEDSGEEDVELGKCLEYLGVKTDNSTDALGRNMFHCFDPETHLFGTYQKWYYDYVGNEAKKGTDGISNYPISFHYISPEKMYALEFYIYHLRLYGK